MADIVQILREMQQEEDCPMLVHMEVSEAIREITSLRAELAALAEQNEKMREALSAMVAEARARNCGLKIADDALSLPNLAATVLTRIHAEELEGKP